MNDQLTSESDKSTSDDDYPQMDPGYGTSNTSDSDDDDILLPFVSWLLEPELLALAAKKRREGEPVPVRIQEEPNNPVDARAIAFMCKVTDQWERIGCLVREALDAVHEAMGHKKILLGEVRCTV